LEEVSYNHFDLKLSDTKEIINQLAEEYKDKVMINGQYCWQTCSATEHCKECNRLCNGSIDYYENYDVLAEEYINTSTDTSTDTSTTNADRIRSVTDEELAEFLFKVNTAYAEPCMIGEKDYKWEDYPTHDKGCKDCFLDWLQSEVEGVTENE
jgi:hypothetical protein